jgi:hypothetical protein
MLCSVRFHAGRKIAFFTDKACHNVMDEAGAIMHTLNQLHSPTLTCHDTRNELDYTKTALAMPAYFSQGAS